MTVQALDSVKKRVKGNGDRQPTHQRLAKFTRTMVVPVARQSVCLEPETEVVSMSADPERVTKGTLVCSATPEGPHGSIVFY